MTIGLYLRGGKLVEYNWESWVLPCAMMDRIGRSQGGGGSSGRRAIRGLLILNFAGALSRRQPLAFSGVNKTSNQINAPHKRNSCTNGRTDTHPIKEKE